MCDFYEECLLGDELELMSVDCISLCEFLSLV